MVIYPLEHPPPLRKYTLKIFHGGDLTTITRQQGNSYQIYRGGEVVLIRNLYLEKARLDVFNDIGTQLGYKRGSKFLYKQQDGKFSEVTDDVLLSRIVRTELSVDRELNIYLINGVLREQTELEQAPAIMFWNCRCLNDMKIYDLRSLILIYQPDILFLSETRTSSTFSNYICFRLGFQDFRDSPTNRHMEGLPNCVGLAMFWKKDVKLVFHDGSDNYLDVMVKVSDSERFRLIGFYGDSKDKNLSWNLLEELSGTSTEDRLVIGGDLNEILEQNEKSGGDEKRQDKIKAFKKALRECKLNDLSYEGTIFTWESKGIKERLDRVVARVSWEDFFPRCRVAHLTDRLCSDHIPILLETDSDKHIRKIRKSVLSYTKEVEGAIKSLEGLDVTTVLRLKRKLDKLPDLYYNGVKLIAPHLIQLKEIAVLENDKVTYEHLVTLKRVTNIGALLLNSIVAPKPPREYKLANLPQFPYCGRDHNNIPLNLSEYLEQTWLLIKFIPAADCEEHKHQIMKKIIVGQVENLLRWFNEVSTRDGIGGGISERLKEKASMFGRALIVYDIVISLLKKERIGDEGKITELEKMVCQVCKYYYGEATDQVRSREMVSEPLQFLLEKFQWRHSDTPLQYRISGDPEEQFVELTEHMLEAERDAAMIKNPWIKSIIECAEKEKPENLVRTSTIQGQLEVLRDIGCIAWSENDKIALSKDDMDSDLIIKRLKKAESEALTKLSKSKRPTTIKAFICKLREAYNRSESNKKREVVGDGGKQGEKKARF